MYTDSSMIPPSFINDLYIVTIASRVSRAVKPLTQLARKKYQHQENAQPGGVSRDAIIYYDRT